MDFRSDNTGGASPEIIAALAREAGRHDSAYGADAVSVRLQKTFADFFEREVAVFPVATGTAANALSLAALAPGYGAIYAHAQAHIAQDEANAPEFFTGGAKLVAVPGTHGRLDCDPLRRRIATATPHGVHNAQPAAVSISQTTELGTVYTPDAVAAVAEVAHSAGLGLHMDGARLANALVALDCAPADITWRAGVDILSFGATKNGALGAEAIVVFDPKRATALPFLRKRAGHLLSKQRFAAAQFEAYLDGDLWRRNAGHANAMARRLAEGLKTVRGASLPHPVEANALFPLLPDKVQVALRDAGFLFGPWGEAGSGMVRLIASFDSEPADVDRFIALSRKAGGTQ